MIFPGVFPEILSEVLLGTVTKNPPENLSQVSLEIFMANTPGIVAEVPHKFLEGILTAFASENLQKTF